MIESDSAVPIVLKGPSMNVSSRYRNDEAKALSRYANAAHIDRMTNCGLLDISSSSNEKDGLKAISIDPIINVGLVIAAFILVLFNIMGQGRGDYLLVRARLMTNVEDMMPGFGLFGKRDCH